ncbi:GNAT family N-acetyltransferase [Arachidicoccus soli]|uniref:GNAT family N-acetyltransferase n=1 Tax=Arachidicoccus soli TaxID=2341117 RepID=A0A386HPA1_9BACT|nr:GNAT family N-acetyltransferase [Arachidicoccus soli]AYD47261.1 GNAT family N-acetyltransferase [Arachidicoccus soli]
MKEIKLVQATEDDYERMYKIKEDSIKPYVEKVWGWDEDFQIEFLRKNTPFEEVEFILFNGETIGFLQLKETIKGIFIQSLFIIKAFQQKGIGTYLLKRIINNGKLLSLEVLKNNKIAFDLYKKMGFVVLKEDDLKYYLIRENQ